MSTRTKATTIDGYMVAFAIAERGPEPVSLFLYDLPGCGVQGKSFPEAMEKLRALVPEYLRSLRERGVRLPEPSREPGFQFVQMGWAFTPSLVAFDASLNQVRSAQPMTVVRQKKADGVQQVEIGQPKFGSLVPAS
jgi:hypothetical protein